MTEAAKVVEQWAAALSARDAAGWAELFSDDCVHEDVAMRVVNRGREAVRAFGQAFFDAVPDFLVTLRWTVGDERSAVSRARWSAGRFEQLGIVRAGPAECVGAS